MRHFSRRKLGTMPPLSSGVLARAPVRALVFGSGPPQRLTASNREARFLAVDLPAIARAADADLFAASGAAKLPHVFLGRPRVRACTLQQTFLTHRGRLVLLRATMANIGRNDPCVCGSGKKYKRCCYLAAVAPVLPPAAVATAPAADHHHNHLCDYCVEDRINRLADSALDLLLADRHDEAEAVCHQLMSEFPDEVEGIDMLAMVCEARGDRRRALELLRQAIDIADSTPDFDAETRSLMYERRIELETSQHA